MVESTDAGMFCELEKESSLLVVIGLSVEHPETSLCVHLVKKKKQKVHQTLLEDKLN